MRMLRRGMTATDHQHRRQTWSGLAGVVQLRAMEPAARRQQRRGRQGAPEQDLAEADEAHAVQVEIDLTAGNIRLLHVARLTAVTWQQGICTADTPLEHNNHGDDWVQRGSGLH